MEVRFFRKDERDLLIASIKKLWRHDHVYVRKPEVLEHLVLHTPYREVFAGEDNYSYVGMWDEDGNVVGIYGAIPQMFNVLGKSYQSETASTWMIDKNCGKHVNGLSMRNFVYEKDVKAAVYFSLSDEAYRINKFYYDDYMTADFPRWIGFRKRAEAIGCLLPSNLPDALIPCLCEKEIENNYVIEKDNLVQNDWDEYYYQIFAPVTVGTKRDYQFLKWRYMESPVLKYQFIAIRDSQGNYLGLSVIRKESIMDGKLFIGRILEFICLDAEASISLANAVIKSFTDVVAWDFYCLSDITAYGLEAVGLRKVPTWMKYTVLPTRFQPIDFEHVKLNGAVYLDGKLREKIRQMTEIPWYLTRGDSDQDRAN